MTTTTAAPLPPSGFVAFGNLGKGPGQRRVAEAAEAWAAGGHRVDALVTTGDNVYWHGEAHHFDDALDAPYARLRGAARPLWVTLGDRDILSGQGDALLDHLELPPLPYEKRLPSLRILFLDTNERAVEGQVAWLFRHARRDDPRFTVAVMHRSAYSCGPHGSSGTIRERWVPILERFGVDLVVAGEDHLYQRFEMRSPVYVVSGGGGSDLTRPRSRCGVADRLVTSAAVHHFLTVEASGRRMVVRAVGADGRVLDRFTVRR